jgi:heat shock protein HtpX
LSFWWYRQLIFSFSDAHPITRKEYPKVRNAVENLCISRGLPIPNIGILEDDSMNAFALGRGPKHAWIVFSRGLIDKLTPAELEAVAGHELTHIINRDTLMMTLIVVYV